ncbi:hypothetical protein E4U44_008286 [Claviceps purpurea]|nr:hypothetical protein E4U44_008286 [Claviceps purpurea]
MTRHGFPIGFTLDQLRALIYLNSDELDYEVGSSDSARAFFYKFFSDQWYSFRKLVGGGVCKLKATFDGLKWFRLVFVIGVFNSSTKVGTSGGKPDGLRVIVPGKLGGGFDGHESRRDRGGAARRLREPNFVVKLIVVEIDQS